ncbi:FAD-dependent oxidoreductase [Sorangium sp. So ce1151]|uniref:FAD-dependent oxidoreductase n=1 Tax=Sorangium sp. So ce1151 TaxID=3133332 RepID=UPI003F636095
MSTPATLSPPLASDTDDLADVLVIGGGPAGAWAALGAAASGARSVVLVDKGYCGTSGATAPTNTGTWYVTPEGAARERAIEARFARSGGLAHREWMARFIEATWTQINQLAAWGYPFPVDDSDLQYRANLSRGNRMLAVARALRRGPVYAVLDRAGPEIQRWLRDGQPNCFLPHDRLGLDPFTQRFPVTLRSEGTVRGSGGIRVLDDECATSVPGLYAAGDAASRELIVGASSGGGSPNAAWAISSGTWAGRAAARFRAGLGDSAAARPVRAAGTVGLRPGGTAGGLGAREVIDLVQQEMLPLDKNLFRRGDQLEASVERLEGAWRDASAHLRAAGVAQVRAREAAALLATARFCYRSALARAESRGLHQRTDLPDTDPEQAHCLTTGGLSSIWVAPRRLPDQRLSSAPHQGDLA